MKFRTVLASLNPVTLRSARAVRSFVLLGVTCALVLALSAGSASATTLSPTSSPLPSGSNFQGGDGDQLEHNSGANLGVNSFDDWETLAATSGSNLTTNPDPGTNDSCFSGGKKQLDPGDWTYQADPACDPGVSP